MTKKLIAVLCVLSLSLSLFIIPTASAKDTVSEMLINGDFEVLKSNGTVYGWLYNGDSAGIITDDAVKHGGKYAVRFKSTNTPLYLSQNISHLVDTCTYELSVWMYMVEALGSAPRIKFEFQKQDAGGKLVPNGELDLTFKDMTKDAWKEHKFQITPPKGTVSALMLVRLTGSNPGEFLWDDLSLKGVRADGYVAVPLPESVPLAKLRDDQLIPYNEKTAVERFKNGGFEVVATTGNPTSWSIKENGGTVDAIAEDPKEGRFSAVVQADTSTTGTILYQTVKGLIEGVEYKLSGWAKMSDAAASATIKIEWHDKSGAILIDRDLTHKVKEANKCEYFEFLITVPIQADSAVIMFRPKNTKVKYSWDSLSFKGKMEENLYPKDS